MKANVRSVFSSDVDVWTYEPVNPHDDWLWIRFMIGPDGGEGEESFDLLVCTLDWLQREVLEAGFAFGAERLVVREMDLRRVIADATARFESVQGETWAEIATSLSKYAHWEFDGYQD